MNNGSVWAPLRALVKYSGKIAGAGILFMMAVTCVDIVLRRLGTSSPGAYDLVRIAGGITIAAALPLTPQPAMSVVLPVLVMVRFP